MGRPRVRTASLRADMCAAAVRLLDGSGPSAVTTRAVAAATGSSIAAVDELFGGKPGLIRSIHAEGFAQLARTLDALEPEDDPDESVLQLAQAFRRFAHRHRHVYEVMFSRPFAEFAPDDDDRRSADVIYAAVLARVAAALGPDRRRGAAKDAAIGLFAAMRGLASLEAAGVLGSHAGSIERRWRTTVLAVLDGFRNVRR